MWTHICCEPSITGISNFLFTQLMFVEGPLCAGERYRSWREHDEVIAAVETSSLRKQIHNIE